MIAMKTTALVLLLVAGSADATPQSPSTKDPDHESTARVTYNEKVKRPAASDDWIQVGTPTPASHGREYITIDPDAGAFVRLRIDATAGRPIVRSVRLDFKDGKSRVVSVDRIVEKSKPAYVDLGGAKQLERIVVVSEGSAKASYAVYAAPNSGGVATR
jgi:hypothetical protein